MEVKTDLIPGAFLPVFTPVKDVLKQRTSFFMMESFFFLNTKNVLEDH